MRRIIFLLLVSAVALSARARYCTDLILKQRLKDILKLIMPKGLIEIKMEKLVSV